MSDKLPDNIIRIGNVIKRDFSRPTACHHQRFSVDEKNKKVYCQDCEAEVPAIDAMITIAKKGSMYDQTTEAAYEQRKELENWQPRLLKLRELEKQWRGNLLPCCPFCNHGLFMDDLLKGGVGKEFEKRRREKKDAK
jgi:hypothetical protein